jgi:hypothetical protein
MSDGTAKPRVCTKRVMPMSQSGDPSLCINTGKTVAPSNTAKPKMNKPASKRRTGAFHFRFRAANASEVSVAKPGAATQRMLSQAWRIILAMEYRVMLDDGHSCMGGDESVADSCFESYAAAVERCETIVRESLAMLASQGFSGDALRRAFEARGAQPFIMPAADPPFDAIAFAEQLIHSSA